MEIVDTDGISVILPLYTTGRLYGRYYITKFNYKNRRVGPMSLRTKANQKGFTIIELLIVIVVIGILAALVLNAFGNIQERARDTERRTDINSIHTQLELYYADNTSYPSAITVATLPDLNPEALTAPTGTYNFTATPAGCTTAAGTCTSYTLNAVLEADGTTFSRDSLN